MARLIPWKDTAKRLEGIRQEMDRLLDRLSEMVPFIGQEFVPCVDVIDAEKEIIVQAEIPGIDPKELNISLNGRMLTIKGEKKSEYEEKKENYYRMERKYGVFSRTIELPADVDPDKVEATYKDGVLKIRLPKMETGKKISVKTE